MRIDKGHIVGSRFVRSFRDDKIVLSEEDRAGNPVRFTVSRRKKKDCYQQYLRYCKEGLQSIYRVVLMIANILELINLIVLFKVVLGHGFRRNRSLLFIGGLLAAGYIVIEEIPVCGDFIMTWGYLVEGPYLMLIMSRLFNGKIWTTAGISIVEYFFISNVANFLLILKFFW